MSKLFSLVAIVAFLLIYCVSALAQSANNPPQEKPEDRKVQDEAQCKSEKNEKDTRKYIASVSLELIFRSTGKVEVVKVLEVTPEDLPKEVADDYVKKSIDAAKRIKFTPAMKNGRVMSQYVTVVYNFGSEAKEVEKK